MQTDDAQNLLDKQLRQAVTQGDRGRVRECIEQGASLEAKETYGWRPLDLAAWHDKPDCILELLTQGAPLEAKRENGWTALHTAASFNRVGSARALLACGADATAAREAASKKGHVEIVAMIDAHARAQKLLAAASTTKPAVKPAAPRQQGL